MMMMMIAIYLLVYLIHCFIDLNSMSTSLGLFYTEMFRICIHSKSLYTFFCCCFSSIFSHSYIILGIRIKVYSQINGFK